MGGVYEGKADRTIAEKQGLCFFWLATAFSMDASNILQFALALHVLELTGSGIVFASTLSVIVIPRILLTPIAGILADRKKKIRLMAILNAASFLILLSFTLFQKATAFFPLPAVFTLVVLLEIVEVFYQAPERSILPELVPDELLSEAVSLSKVDDGVVYVASPLIGALLYKNIGLGGALLGTTVLLLFSSLLHLFIQAPYAKQPENIEKASARQYADDFKKGLFVIRQNRFLRAFILVTPLMTFSFSAVYSVTITVLMLKVFSVSEYIYGIYRSVSATMVLIVPLFAIPLIKKHQTEKLIWVSSLVVAFCLLLTAGAAFIGMQIKSALIPVVVAITMFDCCTIAMMMPVHLSVSVFYQKNIQSEFRSRIMSVSRMASMTAMALGELFYGFLTDHLPAYWCILIAAFGVGICAPMMKRAFRIERKKPAASIQPVL